MIDHSSDRRFSTGVPVRATRPVAVRRRAARAVRAAGFLICWASSSTTTSQSEDRGTSARQRHRLHVDQRELQLDSQRRTVVGMKKNLRHG
jgi:hypothetical protein